MHLDWEFYPKQFSYISDCHRYVGFVGAIGTGKTRALVVKSLLKAIDSPGSYGTITAPTYPMLRDATKRTFFEIVPRELIAYHNASDNQVGIHTPGGEVSTIYFRSTSDPDTLRGPNLLWVAMDEAAMSPEEAFLILMGRIRDTRFPASAQQLFLATTPKGMNWVYNIFGYSQTDGNYASYYATIDDNPWLAEEYKQSLKDKYSGAFAQQELEGKFVPYSGLVYGDLFRPDLHLGTYPFNPDLPVDLCWDFGYPAPEAILAIQTDARGQVFVFDELYCYKTLTEDIVAQARSRPWFSSVIDCIADEARPDSISRLQNLGVPARPSRKGKILDGIQKVRSLLSLDKVSQLPILHIDRKCDGLLNEISHYRWGERNEGGEEREGWTGKPIDSYNHALDALRYWTISKWSPLGAVDNEELQTIRRANQGPKRRVMKYQLVGMRKRNSGRNYVLQP